MKVLHPDKEQFSCLVQLEFILMPKTVPIAENEIVLVTAPENYPTYPFQVVIGTRFRHWMPLADLPGHPPVWGFQTKAWWILRDPFGIGELAVSGRKYHGGEAIVDVHEVDEMIIRQRGIHWTGPLQRPGPPREVMRTWTDHETRRLFHKLWSQSGGPDYNKQDWKRLRDMLEERGVVV